jgi:hypothetical protein
MTEREVVRLAREGLTNREIGARLYMSRSTVKAHLSHVFAKLGISSRIDACGVPKPVSSRATPICRRNRILAPKLGDLVQVQRRDSRWPGTFEPLPWATAVWTANVRSEVTHHLYEELVAEGAPAFLTFDRAAAAFLPCRRRRTGASQAVRSPSASRTVARESSTCESQRPSSLSKSTATGSPGRCLRPGACISRRAGDSGKAHEP